MSDHRLGLVVAGTLFLLAVPQARGNQVVPPKAPSLPGAAAETASPEDLQAQIDELRERLKQQEEERLKAISPLSVNGYVDFGFFYPRGNRGQGWIQDFANRNFPEFSGYSWTFLGDILGTTVNTRGEAADLGDAPGVKRYDSIDSDGAPGFLVNEVNLRVGYQLAEKALLRTSVNFAPRTARQDFALGDSVDVDIAELEYVLTDDGNTSVFVGKMLPVFGIEYKERKSHQRFGITPSLVDRYTSGPQLGLKLRTKLFGDWLIAAASVTNNSSTTEQFHFYSEIDKNSGKTLNGRLAVSVPIGDLIPALRGDRLEIGGSGEWGPQDRAGDNVGSTWFAGGDLQYLGANYALKGQVIIGKSEGQGNAIWALDLRPSGYVSFEWQFLPYLGAIVRAELRDAFVGRGMDRAYLTKQMRFGGGVRVVFSPRIVLKLEYLHNREYGGIPQFENDIFTSSLVLAH